MRLRVRVLALTALLASACGAPPRPDLYPDGINPRPTPIAEAVPPAPIPPPIVSEPPPPVVPRVETVPELRHFYAALRELENKSRKKHVRVYWMGDSHGAADFWSGALRSGLQRRFGDGGPGYLHLGYKDYRHDGVKLVIDGKWRMRPKRPVHIEKQDDGVYGIGGLLMGGYRDGPRVEAQIDPRAGVDRLVVDFCYRLKKQDDAIDLANGAERVTLAASEAEPPGVIRHHTMTLKPPFSFSARPTQGSPDFCGAHVESDATTHPGVVLDTLSINGARYATALAWDEDAWVAEATLHPPDLAVFEYGTNEAGGGAPPFTKIEEHLSRLLARVRRANAEVDCVVVSATDRADAEDPVVRINETLQRAAKKEGCWYFDAHARLGGKGAMAKLREEPNPKVQADGIHMTISGYRELGGFMLEELLRGYVP